MARAGADNRNPCSVAAAGGVGGGPVSTLEHKVWPLVLLSGIITELRGILRDHGIRFPHFLQMWTMRQWRWGDCLRSF